MAEQMQQLQRRVLEQILQRAEADPEWRRQFIEDSQTAMEGIPEVQQLQEMLESTRPAKQPPEITPSSPEEYQQRQRILWEKVLERAAKDPQWKQQLIDDPEVAIREATFPEGQELQEMGKSAEASVQAAEVHGHCAPYSTFIYAPQNGCYSGTLYALDKRDFSQ